MQLGGGPEACEVPGGEEVGEGGEVVGVDGDEFVGGVVGAGEG